jgi:hypothetical protein
LNAALHSVVDGRLGHQVSLRDGLVLERITLSLNGLLKIG